MNRIARRLLASAFFASIVVLPLACDSKSGGTSSGETIATNFGISLKSVVAAEGMPDSVVAVVSVDGVAVDTVVPGLSGLSDSTIRFPVDAPEGSKVSVVYQMYKDDGVVAAGQVAWVSGEAVYIPRPNIAPRVSIRNAKADAIVRRNAFFVLRTESSDPENKSRELQIDWNGDGTLDQSIAPPTGRDSVRLSWDKAGTYMVTTWVKDDQGLRRRDTLSVRVVPVATIALSQDTTVSVGDSVDVLVSMSYDDPSQASSMKLAWGVDGETSTTEMASVRRFAWSKSGSYRVVAKALDAAGEASRDTMVITVVQDAPKLDLGGFPAVVNLGGVATLPIGVEQSFGTIVRWGMDFDGIASKGWDTTGTGLVPSVQHIFGRSGSNGEKILVFVEDDDGNRTVDSARVSVSATNEGAVLRRVTGKDTTVSLSDSATLRFQRSFPEGLESSSRMEWMVDGDVRDTTAVELSRSFAWSKAGSHKVAWRLATPIGSTSWDTVNVDVVSDAPELSLSSFPSKVDRNTIVALAPKATDRYGSIVRWGMDFDGDTATGWDTTAQGEPGTVMHVFSTLDTSREVLVFVEDDDGNRVVKSRVLEVGLGSELLSRTSESSRRVSIGDTVTVTFQENFAVAGTRSVSRQVWRIDDLAPETLSVSSERRFAWNVPGRHVIRMSLATPYGIASEDSSMVDVVRDAPVLDLSNVPATVPMNDLIPLQFLATQQFGRVVDWKLDFDGDTATKWDTVGTGAIPSRIERSFPSVGRRVLHVRVSDDDGNVSEDSVAIEVVSSGFGIIQKSVSADTTLSIRDSAWIRLRLGSAIQNQYSTSRLEWRVDEAASETLSVVENRAFRWDAVGLHVVRFRALGTFGTTGWDSVVVNVVQGTPRILSIMRSGSSVGKTITFAATTDPVFGRIVKERWDIGNDGTWDDSSTIAGASVERVFATSVSTPIRVQVLDDDGNADDTVFTFAARNASPAITGLKFDRDSAGVTVAAVLKASYSDPDGADDLALLEVDWTAAGKWDTIKSIRATSFQDLSHAWSSTGVKLVRVRVTDLSGATSLDSVSLRVVADAPAIRSIGADRSAYRLGDPMVLTAVVFDPSLQSDVMSIGWDLGGDGVVDTTVSLEGSLGTFRTTMAWSSRKAGVNKVCAEVHDRAGNLAQGCSNIQVAAMPPRVFAHFADSVPAATDTGRIWIDSIVVGSLAGVDSRSVSVWSKPKDGAWVKWTPAELAVMNKTMAFPATPGSDWYMVVKSVQDNGEEGYDTLRSRILPLYVDPRDGAKYPVIRIGSARWLGRNLRWRPDLGTKIMDSTSPYEHPSVLETHCIDGDYNCLAYGRMYSSGHLLQGKQLWVRDSSIVQGVCPDGWHIPSMADWNAVKLAANAANPGVDWGVSLRSRAGWTTSLPGQTDPLDFKARQVGDAGSLFWVAYLPPEDPGHNSRRYAVDLNSDGSGSFDGLIGKYALETENLAVRCVANESLYSYWPMYDSSDLTGARIGNNAGFTIQGIPYDTSKVTVTITMPSGVAQKSMPMSEFVNIGVHQDYQIGWVLGSAFVPGINHIDIEIMQNGRTVVDSIDINPVSTDNITDSRDGYNYNWVKLGELRWMTEDLVYDAGGKRASDSAFFIAEDKHIFPGKTLYPPVAALGGGTFAPHGSNGPQGVCPDGWRLPSHADWNAALAEVDSRGLDKTRAFRARKLRSGFPAFPTNVLGTNATGLNMERNGVVEEGVMASFDIIGYWTGDLNENGNPSLMSFLYQGDHTPKLVDMGAGDPTPMHLAVRCVSDPQ